jgi:hypothetical protein
MSIHDTQSSLVFKLILIGDHRDLHVIVSIMNRTVREGRTENINYILFSSRASANAFAFKPFKLFLLFQIFVSGVCSVTCSAQVLSVTSKYDFHANVLNAFI